MGDFNAYVNAQKKMGGDQLDWSFMKRFGDFVNNSNLLDVGFKGH